MDKFVPKTELIAAYNNHGTFLHGRMPTFLLTFDLAPFMVATQHKETYDG